MTDRNVQYDVIFFQTGSFGSQVLSLNGDLLTTDDSVYKMGTAAFINDLGRRGFKFASQIPVTMHNGEYRINWVFEQVF